MYKKYVYYVFFLSDCIPVHMRLHRPVLFIVIFGFLNDFLIPTLPPAQRLPNLFLISYFVVSPSGSLLPR